MQPLRAEGRVAIRASVEAVHTAMLDPVILGQVIPGVLRVTRAADGTFTAVLQFGIEFFRDRQTVALRLDEQADGRLSQARVPARSARGPLQNTYSSARRAASRS